MSFPRRVLVVNDLETVSEMLAAQLGELGFAETKFVRDGSEALEVLDREDYDIVISDIHMPILDGFQLCRLLRSPEFPRLNRVPVVLLSATYRDHAAGRLAREAGAQGFLQWPFTHEELGSAIDQALTHPEKRAGVEPRVLVADDDEAIRTLLTAALRQEGFEVLTVANGEEAIRAGEAFKPHLVLCDYMMPKVDGRAVLRWYREQRPDTPVVIITAHGSERVAVDMMRSGAYEYVIKPFDVRGVARLCRSALEKYNVKGISRQFEAMLVSVRRAEARYRALFEHAGDAIFLCDAAGKIEEINRRASEILGVGALETIGRSLRDFATLSGEGGDVTAWAQRGAASSVEATLQSRVRGRLPVELSVARLTVEGEEHLLAVARDLSDRKWIGAFVREEHDFLKLLHENTPLIDSEAGLREFLARILRVAMERLGMVAGAVLSRGWGREEDLLIRVARGVPETLVGEVVLRPESGTEPYRAHVSEEALGDEERQLGLRARMELGLASKGRLYGYLLLWKRNGAEPHERDWMMARAMATHLSHALENASLVARVTRAREDWQRTFDAVAEPLCVVDAEGKILQANRALARAVGTEPEAIRGKSAVALLYDGSPPEDEPLRAARAAGEPRSAEHALPGLGKGIFVVTASPLFSEDGSWRGAVLVARDVTAERHAQRQLLISEKMSTIGRMAAGVTHEINNPAAFVLLNVHRLQEHLRTLTAFIEEYRAALRDAGGDEAAARMAKREADLGISEALHEAETIAAESLEGMQRIREITQDLRFFSHIREDRPRPFDLNHVVESAISMARHEVRHRARLVRQLETLPPCEGDPTRMTQVIVNLLVNAAQSVEEGRVAENEVRVHTFARDGRVFVEISDTGCGIPENHIPQIFDPFFTTKAAGAGSGLGLSLCYEIVKRHGGEIGVESRVGAGSTFTVSLPAVARRDDRPAPPPAPEPREPARVLIVDDEVHLHRALRRVLREHELHFATSGREALDLLERDRRWDAIVCDVTMTDGSGVDLYERVAREWPELAPRVAFLTGGVRTEVEEALRRSGRPVLEKPVDRATLRELIARLRAGR
jgi:PAS domain S-box-containing protein